MALFSVVVFFVLVYFGVKLSRTGRRERGLPPGPPTLPVLGNLLIFPTQKIHRKLTEWSREYGEIYSLKIASGTAIVISSASVAKELLDKRSVNTSGRPQNYLADVITGGIHMGVVGYTDTWRLLRKSCQNLLTPQAARKHVPIQQAETKQLMYDMLKTPERFFTDVRRHSMSTILSMLFGKRCPRYETKEATAFFNAIRDWEKVITPGAHPPLDLIPILKYVPERWASWKTECRNVAKQQRDLYFSLLVECEDRVANGRETECFMDQLVKNLKDSGLTREMAGFLGGVLIEGGAETSASFLQSFILLLVTHPEVQRKAQEEVDQVIGSQRAPVLEDIQNLPYLKAVMEEVHRFRPILPVSIPHAATVDEGYREYVIPKDSTIIFNMWAFCHDPALYENPDAFDPDRFIRSEYGTKPGVDDKDFRHTFMFGYGRRICPGMNVGNNMVALATMNLIWGFTFSPAIDPETKQVIAITADDYHEGMTVAPEPFKCTITSRSALRAGIIEKDFQEAIQAFLPFEERLDREEKDWVSRIRQ